VALGYRSVNEMLGSLSSNELTEWLAYEKVAGPLGNAYLAEILAAIQEQLQHLSILTAQDKNARVQHVPRPHELYERSEPYAMDEGDVTLLDSLVEEEDF
jgi:hypothetical protein